MAANLTHLNDQGQAHMVDVSGKAQTQRLAIAGAKVIMNTTTRNLLRDGTNPKGDVMATARLAGIMAAKRTADLIPLCHPLPINKVTVDITLSDEFCGAEISATVKTAGQTGVEMEALIAASVAALTLYDMLKAVDKGIVISDVQLFEKQGGESGTWHRET